MVKFTIKLINKIKYAIYKFKQYVYIKTNKDIIHNIDADNYLKNEQINLLFSESEIAQENKMRLLEEEPWRF